ncbi:MAG: hypothetical protein JWN22_45 [Nocardioides sp.]|jgi:hypothetical protein|nr:hypothetical protein [Nocardioides sp.]
MSTIGPTPVHAEWTTAADELELSLSTPFERWCESVGLHPEAFGAWESFQRLAQPHGD